MLSAPAHLGKLTNMRRPLDSPFSPGSDTVPQVWAGRAAQLSDWRDVLRPRRLGGIAERGRTILGEAGTGKSSLVRKIAADAAQGGDWVTSQLRIPAGADPLKRVAVALIDLAREAGLAAAREERIKRLLGRVEAVALSGVSVSLREAAGPDPYTSLSELLIEIGREAARHKDRMVLLHVDEVQNITDDAVRSQLLIALGDALVHEERRQVPGGVELSPALPLSVYLTGLPEFQDTAGSRTGATFARRFQTTTLGALDEADLALALHPFVDEGWVIADAHGHNQRIRMTPTACRALIDLSCGEPFLFQLAGERAWFAGVGNMITAEEVHEGWRSAAAEAETHVQRVLARLPAREERFLRAMAALDPHERTLTQIARQMGHAHASELGTTAQRLDLTRGIVERGRPYTFRHRAVEAFLTSSWPWV